jgi:hypothetical protein
MTPAQHNNRLLGMSHLGQASKVNCYGWLAVVFNVNGGGVILNVNNK